MGTLCNYTPRPGIRTEAWSSTKCGQYVKPMQIFHYSIAFSQAIQVTRIIGSYAEAANIYLTTRRRAAALQGERLGDNEEFFAGGHSKL